MIHRVKCVRITYETVEVSIPDDDPYRAAAIVADGNGTLNFSPVEVNGVKILGRCDCCRRFLFDGDAAIKGTDGVVHCGQCFVDMDQEYWPQGVESAAAFI